MSRRRVEPVGVGVSVGVAVGVAVGSFGFGVGDAVAVAVGGAAVGVGVGGPAVGVGVGVHVGLGVGLGLRANEPPSAVDSWGTPTVGVPEPSHCTLGQHRLQAFQRPDPGPRAVEEAPVAIVPANVNFRLPQGGPQGGST